MKWGQNRSKSRQVTVQSGEKGLRGRASGNLLKTNKVAWPGLAFTLLQAKVDCVEGVNKGAGRKKGEHRKSQARPGHYLQTG